MHKSVSTHVKETHVIVWDFDIHTTHLIPAMRPDLVIIKKNENLIYSGFCCSRKRQSENKRKHKKETSTLTLPENRENCGL